MISCAKHTIFGCDFCSGAQPPGAANDVHAEIEGCHCEPVVLRAANQNLNDCQWQSYLSVAHAGVAPSRDSLRSQSPGYSGSLNRISRGRCPHRPKAKACAYISALNQCFNVGPSGGNVLVPARTLRRSRLRGRCRTAAPLSSPGRPNKLRQNTSACYGWFIEKRLKDTVSLPRGEGFGLRIATPV